MISNPAIELLAAKVHEAWMQEKRSHGIWSRVSDLTGAELLVPYAELAETDKDADRVTVRTVLAAIDKSPYVIRER